MDIKSCVYSYMDVKSCIERYVKWHSANSLPLYTNNYTEIPACSKCTTYWGSQTSPIGFCSYGQLFGVDGKTDLCTAVTKNNCTWLAGMAVEWLIERIWEKFSISKNWPSGLLPLENARSGKIHFLHNGAHLHYCRDQVWCWLLSTNCGYLHQHCDKSLGIEGFKFLFNDTFVLNVNS